MSSSIQRRYFTLEDAALAVRNRDLCHEVIVVLALARVHLMSTGFTWVVPVNYVNTLRYGWRFWDRTRDRHLNLCETDCRVLIDLNEVLRHLPPEDWLDLYSGQYEETPDSQEIRNGD